MHIKTLRFWWNCKSFSFLIRSKIVEDRYKKIAQANSRRIFAKALTSPI